MSGKSVPARRSDLSPALGVLSFLHPGVLTGDETMELFRYAQKHGFAIPAVNCTNSDTVNSCLEAAAAVKSPIIIQFSNGGAAFVSGKGLKTDREQGNAIMGSVVGAKYVHSVAAAYGVPVVLGDVVWSVNLMANTMILGVYGASVLTAANTAAPVGVTNSPSTDN